jgi:hypothetical protein
MRFVIATTTLNAADVIGEFLGHIVTLPVDSVLIMDLGSVDETLERKRALEGAERTRAINVCPLMPVRA